MTKKCLICKQQIPKDRDVCDSCINDQLNNGGIKMSEEEQTSEEQGSEEDQTSEEE